MIHRIEWIVMGVILAAYLVIGWEYAARTPDWQTPDEPAHYNYVRQIVEEKHWPVLKMGDWQEQYQEELVSSGFDPALTARLDTVEYEDHQPPLYYLLQVPVYALTDGDLTAMRLFSVLLGTGVILTAWATLRLLTPRWPYIALTGAGFIAFVPQHLAVLASVSNDSLAELVVSLMLLATTVYLGNRHTNGEPIRFASPILLGILVGIALITKTTIYFLAGIAGLAVLLRWRRERWSSRQGLNHLAAAVLPALVIGGVWWVRDLKVYGGTDFTGLSRHSAVTIGQWRTGPYIKTMYGGSTRVYLENYAKTTFRSFWGQFGWMALPMPSRIYTVLLAFTALVMVGFVLFFWQHGWFRQFSGPQRDGLIVLAAVILFTVAGYILYNLEFVQFQGRYLYPALIPFGFLVGVGLNGWTALPEGQIPALSWLPVAAMIGLAVFALYALNTYIVPNLPTW